jgi:hypothetical protein
MHEDTISYNNKQINIITIPKNTIFFKCITNKPNNNADIYGIQTGPNIYCLPRAHNVFFYPQPFIVDSNLYFRSPNRRFYIYKLNHDIRIISLLSATFSEQDAIDAGVLIRCNQLQFCNGLSGKHYDTCISHDFMTRFPDIIGCTRIVVADNKHYRSVKANTYVYDKSIFFEKKERFFVNGIPEIFMYPHKRHIDEDIFYDLSKKPKTPRVSYTLIKSVAHQPFIVDGLYKYMRSMIKSKRIIFDKGWYYYNYNYNYN